MIALRRAIGICGGVSRLAKRIGERQPTVSNWIMRGRIPPKKVRLVAEATGYRVTCHDLAPDIYPRGAETKIFGRRSERRAGRRAVSEA